jgi:hypothetical protein
LSLFAAATSAAVPEQSTFPSAAVAFVDSMQKRMDQIVAKKRRDLLVPVNIEIERFLMGWGMYSRNFEEDKAFEAVTKRYHECAYVVDSLSWIAEVKILAKSKQQIRDTVSSYEKQLLFCREQANKIKSNDASTNQ